MATVTNRKIDSFCDKVNKELPGMRMRIDVLRKDLKKPMGLRMISSGKTNGTWLNWPIPSMPNKGG